MMYECYPCQLIVNNLSGLLGRGSHSRLFQLQWTQNNQLKAKFYQLIERLFNKVCLTGLIEKIQRLSK